jgi:hypothetical protein
VSARPIGWASLDEEAREGVDGGLIYLPFLLFRDVVLPRIERPFDEVRPLHLIDALLNTEA